MWTARLSGTVASPLSAAASAAGESSAIGAGAAVESSSMGAGVSTSREDPSAS